jgi:hypothetical protein
MQVELIGISESTTLATEKNATPEAQSNLVDSGALSTQNMFSTGRFQIVVL